MAENSGYGSVAEYEKSYGPYTQDSHKKDPGYQGGRMESKEVAQEIKEWGCGAGTSMKQKGDGSMDYMKKKDSIRSEDDAKLSRQGMPQK